MEENVCWSAWWVSLDWGDPVFAHCFLPLNSSREPSSLQVHVDICTEKRLCPTHGAQFSGTCQPPEMPAKPGVSVVTIIISTVTSLLRKPSRRVTLPYPICELIILFMYLNLTFLSFRCLCISQTHHQASAPGTKIRHFLQSFCLCEGWGTRA